MGPLVSITTVDGDDIVAEMVMQREAVPAFIKALREVARV